MGKIAVEDLWYKLFERDPIARSLYEISEQDRCTRSLWEIPWQDLCQRSRQHICTSSLKESPCQETSDSTSYFDPRLPTRLNALPKPVKYPSGCATRLAKSKQPLSHSATLPEWLPQLPSHSATLPEWLPQPLSHSATQPLW